MAKFKISAKARKKMMQVELAKELKSQTKKTNPRREKTKEHELFEMIDKGLEND